MHSDIEDGRMLHYRDLWIGCVITRVHLGEIRVFGKCREMCSDDGMMVKKISILKSFIFL